MPQLSEYEEMYLKRIFEIYDIEPSTILKTSELAKIMGVSNASSTEMMQRLSSRDLLTYVPYKGCRLTPEGFKHAARVKRREGLLEILLGEVIGFEGDIKQSACKMEHNMSLDLEEALDRMLGYPEKTTKGAKIPVIDRRVDPVRKNVLLPLAFLPIGTLASIEAITVHGSELKTLESFGISLGSKISVEDEGIKFDGQLISLSKSLKGKILTRTEV